MYPTHTLPPIFSPENLFSPGRGHVKLAYALQEKMLSFHKSKSIYLVYGSKKYHKEVEEQVNETPMTLGDIHLKKKE